MLRGAKVPFTREPTGEPTKGISLNVSAGLHSYLTKHGITRTIIRAVEFDRDLGEALKALDERIDSFAASQGVDRSREPAKVVAELIRRGLEAAEAEKASPKGKRP